MRNPNSREIYMTVLDPYPRWKMILYGARGGSGHTVLKGVMEDTGPAETGHLVVENTLSLVAILFPPIYRGLISRENLHGC
ncbi:MAG: hypothetical protein CM15mP47_1120 [Methanobacteriota archaeon]|nr:MAG: hypothetical protein CM15mP47_1120 [Euryarchaeota archaeon]